MHEFQDFILKVGLMDAGFCENPFTWCNNRRGAARIWQRLDRALINTDFQNSFSDFNVSLLARLGSDNTPLCLNSHVPTTKRRSRFIFQRMWTDHQKFMEVMISTCGRQVQGNPGIRLGKKLLHLKNVLKNRNWTSFEDLKDKRQKLQSRVIKLESQLQLSWSENTHSEWDAAWKELQQIDSWENEKLRCQPRMNWMADGDKNSAFYHAVIKERRRRNITQLNLFDVECTTDVKAIGAVAEEFFQRLFSNNDYFLDEDLVTHIQPSISDTENTEFIIIPESDEIWNAIKQLNPLSASGNDGFIGYFFIHYWEVIKMDVMEFVVDFFKGGYLPRSIMDTMLILLPKTQYARQINEYRPISLCTFATKIVSKILANRVGLLLPKLVVEEQAGFVARRNTATHIVMAQEMIPDLDRKSIGGFKLDMAKEYDPP